MEGNAFFTPRSLFFYSTKELSQQPSKVQGGYHVLDYAANHIGWNRIKIMEAKIENEVGIRVHDIVTKDIPPARYELKNFTTYNFTGKVLDQLKRDLAILSPEEIVKLRYVFRGSSTGAERMLRDMQKLGDDILKQRKIDPTSFNITTSVKFLNKEVPF